VVDAEPVQEIAQIGAERRLLARAWRRWVAKTSRPEPAQPWQEDAAAVGGER
jgi:hypothetical protein